MKLNLLVALRHWTTRFRTEPGACRWAASIAAVVVVLAGIAIASLARGNAKAELVPPVTVVAVAKVARADLAQTADFDAEFRPYQEADLHAKVAGFLKKMPVDIGDRVKEGDLLATLEVPELQDDILHAEATVRRSQDAIKRADADYQAAHLIHSRLLGVNKSSPNLLAQQDIDAAQAKDQSAEAALAEARGAVEVARADLGKLETLKSYTHILAPFSGVITKRYADPGALIPGGTSSSQITPLLQLSDNTRLRLAFPVSVSYVSGIQTGQVVQVRIQALEKSFAGTVSRFSRKVDTATRTMDVEVDVDNTDLSLVPGMYATVSLQLGRRDHTLAVPVTAVSRKGAPSVYVVNAVGQIEARTVTIGLETPSMLEVLKGLQEDELVLIGSRAQVQPGQKVEPKTIEATTAP